MACSKQLSLNQAAPAGDFFMNQAFYDPVSGTIVGIRDQWLFQFNATTGAFIQALRFTTNATSTSCMTIFGGKIYCGVLWALTDLTVAESPDRDIFIVDSATFAVVGRMNLGSFNQTQIAEIGSGYRALSNDGTRLAGYCYDQNALVHNQRGLFSFDPTNIAGTYALTSFDFVDDMAFDSFNGVYWIASAAGNIWCVQTSPFDSNQCRSTPTLTHTHGITYNAAQNKVFAVDGTEAFFEASAASAVPAFANFTLTTRHTGRINCNASRIKSVNSLAGNPHNGKVLIPTWDDDAVVIWDPLTNAVESVQTGFTAPYDIVVCPTTNFALQTGVVGLRAIT